MTEAVRLSLRSDNEYSMYELQVSALPGKARPALSKEADNGRLLRLVEGQEYRYEWLGPEGGLLTTEPTELFQPDSASGRAGRLRTGLAVGFVEVTLCHDAAPLGSLEIQVQSRKLLFENEYQWMLRDIAAELTELLMERFAASELRFEQDETRDAVTLYQRFEFLRALLQSGTFKAAIQEILRRPHTGWKETSEAVLLGRGLRGAAGAAKKLARSGFRPGASNANLLARRIDHTRTEATHDTTPNRFLKYALRHWLQILGEIESGLGHLPATAPVLRGRREVAALSAEVDQLLHDDLFREVGALNRFPGEDQVLQKREGYRDVLRAYLEFELGALLSWKTPESHSASSRDVATLYEYWAFLQLAKSVAAVAGATFDLRPLLKVDKSGLSVGISKGQEHVFSGRVTRSDRDMSIELWFNRTYRVPRGSWTRALRPDYSLVIKPEGEAKPHEIVILHFDAKYRVQFIQELLAEGSALPEEGEVDEGELKLRGQATPSDLMKMHAYRDAIRRTSGAYVLYPGGDLEVGKEPLKEFEELLPGLGAFVLRPTDDGLVLGDLQLRTFISEVVDHTARRLTDHERDRYWHEHVYGAPQPVSTPSLDRPPPSASVLLGFVKSASHWRWISKTSSYNLRALGRAGGVAPESTLFQCQLLLLYCPSSGDVGLARLVASPELLSTEALQATGYPRPGGEEYWVVQLAWLNQPKWLSGFTALGLARYVEREGFVYGAPAVVTWSQLMEGCTE